MALCKSLQNGRMRYFIGVSYSKATALVPSAFSMEITNQATGAQVSLAFSNVDYGGSKGTAERIRGTDWLASQGCN
jgi:hypothetical protein